MNPYQLTTNAAKAALIINSKHLEEAQFISMTVQNGDAFERSLDLDYRNHLFQHRELKLLFLLLIEEFVEGKQIDFGTLKKLLADENLLHKVSDRDLFQSLLNTRFCEYQFYQLYNTLFENQRRSKLYGVVENLLDTLASDKTLIQDMPLDKYFRYDMDLVFNGRYDAIGSWMIKDHVLNLAEKINIPARPSLDDLIREIPSYGCSILVFQNEQERLDFCSYSLEAPINYPKKPTLFLSMKLDEKEIIENTAIALKFKHPENLSLREATITECKFFVLDKTFYHFMELETSLKRFKMQFNIEEVYLSLNSELLDKIKANPELIRQFGSISNSLRVRIIVLTTESQGLIDFISVITKTDAIYLMKAQKESEGELIITSVN